MNTEELKKYAIAAKLRHDLQVEQVVYRAAANPAAVLELIAEIERVTKQRDELLAALREIAAWVERYTAGGHPVSVVARAAIAKAES